MIEVHKVLYKTETVFPPPEIAAKSQSQQYTLPAGEYVYDFRFTIPYRANCRSAKNSSSLSEFGIPKFILNSGGIDFA
jgi:hypothetical protein